MTCHPPDPYPDEFEAWQRAYKTTVGEMIPGRSTGLLTDGTPISELPQAKEIGLSAFDMYARSVKLHVIEGYEGLWVKWFSGAHPSIAEIELLAEHVIQKNAIFALDARERMACFFTRTHAVEERLQKAVAITQTKRDKIDEDIQRSLSYARNLQIEEKEKLIEKEKITGIKCIDDARRIARETGRPVYTAYQSPPSRSFLAPTLYQSILRR